MTDTNDQPDESDIPDDFDFTVPPDPDMPDWGQPPPGVFGSPEVEE